MKVQSHLKSVKALALVMTGKDPFPEIKLRKKRTREDKPRATYRRDEAAMRPLVVKVLRGHGWYLKRIENGICGDLGDSIPDYWMFHPQKKIAGFMELKTPTGVLSNGQVVFRDLCLLCKVNHWIVRSVEEAREL